MKRYNHEIVLILVFMAIGLLSVFTVMASSADAAVGRAGADFLQLPAGARATAMGGAQAAASHDAFAPLWNPAAINRIERTSFGFSHQEEVYEVNNEIASYVRPIAYDRTLAVSGRFTHIGGDRRDETGRKIGTFTDYGGSLGAYYAGRVGRNLDWGAGVNLIQQRLAGEEATTFAFDLGLLTEIDYFVPLRVGLAAQNLGRGLKMVDERDPLPRKFRAGVVSERDLTGTPFVLGEEAAGSLQVALDLSYLEPEETVEYGLGIEYGFNDFLFLRTGSQDARGESFDDNLSLGIGVKHRNLTVDYSWSRADLLTDKHMLSVGLKFGGERGEYWEAPPDPWPWQMPGWREEWRGKYSSWEEEWAK